MGPRKELKRTGYKIPGIHVGMVGEEFLHDINSCNSSSPDYYCD